MENDKNKKKDSEVVLDEIVDSLINNRLELTSFVADSLEQAKRLQDLEVLNQKITKLSQENKQYSEEKDELIKALQYIKNWNSSPHEKYINHLKDIAGTTLKKIRVESIE